MRTVWGMLALCVVAGGCSGNAVDELPRATVQLAPSTVEFTEAATLPATTGAATPTTTAPPQTSVPTVDPSAPTSTGVLNARREPSKAFTPKTADEIAIIEIVGAFQRRSIEQSVIRTYDITALEDTLAEPALQFFLDLFTSRKAKGEYMKWGTIQQSVVFLVVVKGTSATAVACDRNDVQVWNSRLTASEDDDILIDGTLGSGRSTYSLVKEGEKWLISQVLGEGALGACSSVF